MTERERNAVKNPWESGRAFLSERLEQPSSILGEGNHAVTSRSEWCEIGGDIVPAPGNIAQRIKLVNPIIVDNKHTQRRARKLNALESNLQSTSPKEPFPSELWRRICQLFFQPKIPTRLGSTESIIQSLAVHPDCSIFALGRRDGSVELRDMDSSEIDVLSPAVGQQSTLYQRRITCIAWCPTRRDILSVSTEVSVFIWTVGSNACACEYEPVGVGGAQFVCWSPCGLYLLVAPTAGGLILWNISTLSASIVSQHGIFCLLQWSPNGARVLAATPYRRFMVFDVHCNWATSHWKTTSGYISNACWSYDENYLLFSVKDQSTVQCLQFLSSSVPSISEVMDVCSLPGPLSSTEATICDIAWDKYSQRLIICAKPESDLPRILVYQTSVKGRVPIATFSSEIPRPISSTDSKYIPQEMKFTVISLDKLCPTLLVVWYKPSDCIVKAYPFIYNYSLP